MQGFENIKSVRQGKILDIEFKSNNVDMNKIMEMCENFLTNPLVEDYTIEEIINKFKNEANIYKSSIEKIDQIINTIK